MGIGRTLGNLLKGRVKVKDESEPFLNSDADELCKDIPENILVSLRLDVEGERVLTSSGLYKYLQWELKPRARQMEFSGGIRDSEFNHQVYQSIRGEKHYIKIIARPSARPREGYSLSSHKTLEFEYEVPR